MTHLIHLSLLLADISLLLALSDSSHGKYPSPGTSWSQISVDCFNKQPELTASCTMNQTGGLILKFEIISWDCDRPQAAQFFPLTIGNDDGNQMCTICCREQSCASSQCKYKDCKNRLKFKLPIQIPSVSVTFNSSTCPLSVTNSTDNQTSSLLWFYEEPKSWIEALHSCYKTGSSLVEITNQTVQDKTVSLLQNRKGLEDGVWVGLQRSIFGTDLNWVWTSGSRSVKPQWNSSIPVDRWNNHCGKLIWDQGSGQIMLVDANCHEELPYICQDPE